MGIQNFMLNSVEHEKSFITSGPGWNKTAKREGGGLCFLYANSSQRSPAPPPLLETFTFLHFFLVLRLQPGRVAQSVGHLTRKSGVLGSIPGLATYFRFSFRFFKKGSCQLLEKVCPRSTG